MEPVTWHYNRGGQTAGPVPFSVIREMVASGELAPTDSVWSQGWADWRLVSSVRELSPAPTHIPSPYARPATSSAAANVARPVLPNYNPGGQSYNGFAIAGFVLSFLFPLLGLIFSWIALNGMKTSGNPEGRGFAMAGAIISGVLLALSCLLFILWFMCVGLAVSNGP